MTLGELTRMFDGQPSEKHTLEVSLKDARTWYADQQELMAINNGLRDAMLSLRHIIDATVK